MNTFMFDKPGSKLTFGVCVILAGLALTTLRPGEILVLREASFLIRSTLILLCFSSLAVISHLFKYRANVIERRLILLCVFNVIIASIFGILDLIKHNTTLLPFAGFEISFFILFILSTYTIVRHSPARLQFFLHSYVAGIVALEIVTYFQDQSLYGSWYEELESFIFPGVPSVLNTNTYAVMLSIGWAVCCYLITRYKYSFLSRNLLLIGILFLFTRAASLGSRSAVINSIFGVLFALISFRTLSRKIILPLILGGLAMTTYTILNQTDLYVPEPHNVDLWLDKDLRSEYSDKARLDTAKISIEGILSSGFLGQGYIKAIENNKKANLPIGEHNQFLLFTNIYGIFFILAFSPLILLSIKHCLANHQTRPLIFPLIASYIEACLGGFFSYYYMSIWIIIVLSEHAYLAITTSPNPQTTS